MTVDVLVVGAGISGLACARRVAAAGLTVRVLDRGRRPGGRLANRSAGGREIDLGAPYCTVSDAGFREVADGWLSRGLLREWTDTFRVAGSEGLGEARPGPMRYAATGGMRALAEDLAVGLPVERRTLDAVGPGRAIAGLDDPPRAVALAMPGPQAVRLLEAHPGVAAAAAQPYAPSIAVGARFARRTWPGFDAAFVSGLPIRWLADDGRSRGDGAAALVAHALPDFARLHLQRMEGAVGPVLDAMRRVLGVPLEPEEVLVHRWTFAQPTEPRGSTFVLDETGIGLCGDGWSERSRVEAAWRSGDDLGAALVARLV